MNATAADHRAQAFRFLISGCTGFSMYYVVALALRHFFAWPDGVCATVATMVATPPTFLLQKHFTFRHGSGDARAQLLGYAMLQGVCAVLVGLVAQLCMRMGLSHYLGFFLGGASGVLVSYVVQKTLIFRR
jgi:putative flippase GtrA